MECQEARKDGVDTMKTSSCMTIQQEMIPTKSLYFVYFGALGSFLPYCNIFLVSVGLSSDEAGFISGLAHAFSAISSPLWGFLSDWTNKRSLIFVVLCIGSGVTVVAKPFVSWKINTDSGVACQYQGNVVNGTFGMHQNLSGIELRQSNRAAQISLISNGSFSGVSSASILGNNSGSKQIIDCTPPLTPYESTLFFVNMILFTIAEIFYTSLSSIIDSMVMNIIRNCRIKAEFGTQRLFGAITYAITSLSAGLAADVFSYPTLTKYTPVFCIALPFFVILIPIGLISIKQGYPNSNPNSKEDSLLQKPIQSSSNRQDFVKTFRDRRNIFFFCSVFIGGILDCVLHSFLFLLMDDNMNASKTSMGVAILIGCTAEILMFPFTGKLIRRLGSPLPCIELGMASHCLRFLVLSYCDNAWASLPVHVLHSVTWAVLWSGEVEYLDRISPQSIHSTMFGFLSALHFSIPSVLGNMLGGVVYNRYGGAVLFRAASCIAGVWVLVMVLCYHVLKIFDIKVDRVVINAEAEEVEGAGAGAGAGADVRAREEGEEDELVSSSSSDQRTIV